MKGRQVVLGTLFGQEAAALVEDGVLIDLLPSAEALTTLAPGAICRGVTDRLMKGQGGAFLRLPDGQTGYLRDRKGLGEGKPVLVQVTGVAEPGKAVPLTSRLIYRGRYVLVSPGAPGVNVSRRVREPEIRDALQALGETARGARDHGLILRGIAAEAEPDEVAAEIVELLDLADQIAAEASGGPELLLDAPGAHEQAWLDWGDPAPDAIEEGEDSFERCGVLDAVDALLSPRVVLGGGADAWIEQTRALVAIDVNTGADNSPAASLKANIALARDLPRQLRLRGLGGQIVIDFAPMPKRDRGTLEQVLQAAFRSTGAEVTLTGWTAMGLFEMNRKRDRVPLRRLAEAVAH